MIFLGDSGIAPNQIMEHVGHGDLKTTSIYLQNSQARAIEAIKKTRYEF